MPISAANLLMALLPGLREYEFQPVIAEPRDLGVVFVEIRLTQNRVVRPAINVHNNTMTGFNFDSTVSRSTFRRTSLDRQLKSSMWRSRSLSSSLSTSRLNNAFVAGIICEPGSPAVVTRRSNRSRDSSGTKRKIPACRVTIRRPRSSARAWTSATGISTSSFSSAAAQPRWGETKRGGLLQRHATDESHSSSCESTRKSDQIAEPHPTSIPLQQTPREVLHIVGEWLARDSKSSLCNRSCSCFPPCEIVMSKFPPEAVIILRAAEKDAFAKLYERARAMWIDIYSEFCLARSSDSVD